jgi:hypothetical protein
MSATQVRTQALCLVPGGEVIILVRAFASPWPCACSIPRVAEPFVLPQEINKGRSIADSKARSMSILKMVNETLPGAPIVGTIHQSGR